LHGYEVVPEKSFWLHFPSRKLLDKIYSSVDVATLKKEVECLENALTESEISRAMKCISYLTSGAPAFQKTTLGPCWVKNSKAALDFGQDVTGSIASWIKKGFVAGPFDSPPLPNFRANSILGIPQPDKVQICINVSLPKDASLNDNVNKF
jgi:hypothetical protein